MVEQSSARRSFLKPVVGGLVVLGALVAAIYFRVELWEFIKVASRAIGEVLTDWIPNHPGQAAAVAVFAVVAFALNWIAHVRGRVRAWVFALIVEAGLWVLFWYGAFVIPPLNELMGTDIERMTWATVFVSALVVIALTGAVFWFLETKEEWSKYRRRHHVDDD